MRRPAGSDDLDRRRSPGRGSPPPIAAALVALLALPACTPDTPERGAGEQAEGTAPSREVIRPEGSSPSSLYSPAIRSGDVLYLSGTLGFDPETGDLPEGVGPQTRQTMENLRSRLETAGAGLDDLLKCTVLLADIDDYGAMNEVYRTYFEDVEPPARSAFAVSGLAADARVEIECIAAAPR